MAFTWVAIVVAASLYIGWTAGPEQGWAFASAENLETILRQTAIVGFAAVGMTFVIVSGMIDLSVGSVVAFVTVVVAWLLERGWPPAAAALAGIGAGWYAGLLNGSIVNALRLSPFIVTLGSLLIFRGIAKGLANNQKIDAPMTWLAELLARLEPEQRWMLVPAGVWLLAAVSILASLALGRTAFGRRVVAVGANERAARLAGVSPEGARMGVFALSGILVGIAGVLQFSRLTTGDPSVAVGLELDVIAAAVIGGASLAGGQGSIAGSLLGAFVISTLRAACSQAGFPNNIQEIVTGTIIVGAVALDRWRTRAPA